MTYGAATADNWAGGERHRLGTPGSRSHYRGTDANGVASYDVTSADNGYGTQTLRVLRSTNPAARSASQLPLRAPGRGRAGNGLRGRAGDLASLDAQDQYNLTIIEPSFGIEPWYADNPNDSNLRYETFMTNDLLPWVTQNLSTHRPRAELADRVLEVGHRRTGSSSEASRPLHAGGILGLPGGHVDATTNSGSSSANSIRDQRELPGQLPPDADLRRRPQSTVSEQQPNLDRRIPAFQTDISDYDALSTSEGIAHTTETPNHDPPLGQRLGTYSVDCIASGQHSPACALAKLSFSNYTRPDAQRSLSPRSRILHRHKC